MKHFLKSHISPLSGLVLGLCVASPLFAAGGTSSGGGDHYVLDFVRVATQEIYPWLIKEGETLRPNVDANSFLMAVDPTKILSVDRVHESCNDSSNGREVEACFNADTGLIKISRTRYPLEKSTPAKRGLVAHEIFRKMNVEGDDYKISKQIPIMSVDKEHLKRGGDFPREKINLGNFHGVNFRPVGFYCGLHLEVSGSTLVVTNIVPPQLGENYSCGASAPYGNCRGQSFALTCDSNGDCRQDDGNQNLLLLADGNIFSFDNAGVKYLRHESRQYHWCN